MHTRVQFSIEYYGPNRKVTGVCNQYTTVPLGQPSHTVRFEDSIEYHIWLMLLLAFSTVEAPISIKCIRDRDRIDPSTRMKHEE